MLILFLQDAKFDIIFWHTQFYNTEKRLKLQQCNQAHLLSLVNKIFFDNLFQLPDPTPLIPAGLVPSERSKQFVLDIGK
jgi:hypothetical protein